MLSCCFCFLFILLVAIMKVDSIDTTILLNDGNNMPLFGLGCWDMRDRTVYDAVRSAVHEGYCLFDTAQRYGNEAVVGKALLDSGLRREEYFVVTKFYHPNNGYEEAKLKLKRSLLELGLNYVDLYLIHTSSQGRNIETWKAFVELKQEGLAKSIGVSNFNVQHLEPLLETGLEVPAVNQFELHPWNQHVDTVKYCREKKIAIMGYCPLARGRLFDDGKYPVLDEMSSTYKRTKAQIILRWAVQSGYVTIPKTEKVDRIRENGDLYGWELSDSDMKLIDGLDEQLSISIADGAMSKEWYG